MTIVALYAEAFVGPGFVVRPNTPVTILLEDGVTLAALFSDMVGTTGPNPVSSNDLGNLLLRLAPGRYRMRAGGAISDVFEVALPASAMGIPGGVATLDSTTGKLTAGQIPDALIAAANNIDGGGPDAVYSPGQVIDGGSI